MSHPIESKMNSTLYHQEAIREAKAFRLAKSKKNSSLTYLIALLGVRLMTS